MTLIRWTCGLMNTLRFILDGGLILGTLLCITPAHTDAAINAASCAQVDVQTAINSASAGDTVAIPAGTATWGANGSSLSVGKAIVLQGSGQDTTIIDIAPTAGAWTSTLR